MGDLRLLSIDKEAPTRCLFRYWNHVEVRLDVELGVPQLVDSREELRSGSHSPRLLFLDSGVLDVSAVLAGESVEVTVEHSPFLHRDLTDCSHLVISKAAYFAGWQRLIDQLRAAPIWSLRDGDSGDW